MPWLSFTWNKKTTDDLAKKYGVSGIPMLVVLKNDE